MALAYHLIVVGIGAAVVGIGAALAVWGCWIAIFVGPLTIVRFLGEAEEHVYSGAGSVVEATISNDGIVDRLLIHPHRDGLHVAHHAWPTVPHHRLRRLDELARHLDPAGYGQSLRARRFRRPTSGGTRNLG